MIRLFTRYIIGGRTGKREQAWAVFLLWCGAFLYFMTKEAGGAELPGSQAILSLAFPFVTTNLALAYGAEWVSAQSKWSKE